MQGLVDSGVEARVLMESLIASCFEVSVSGVLDKYRSFGSRAKKLLGIL